MECVHGRIITQHGPVAGPSPIARWGALYSYEGTFQMQNLILGKAITGFSAFV